LIFPSARNAQVDYDKFLDHSLKCYEKFTGSYSKNTGEEAAKALAEKEALVRKPIIRYPFSP
jgi:arsenate reductase-like glutaredoxin family protein